MVLKTQENTVQREDVLGKTLQWLEIEGLAATTPEIIAERLH